MIFEGINFIVAISVTDYYSFSSVMSSIIRGIQNV